MIDEEDHSMDIGFLMAATTQSGDLAETARMAESLGYESFWIPEHPVIPVVMTTPFSGRRRQAPRTLHPLG